MALIKCDECGKDVSDKAVSCPGCGNPIATLFEWDASNEVDKPNKVSTQETSQELKFEENASRVKLYYKKSNIAAGVYLVTLALVIYLVDQVDGNVWNGKNPFIATVFTINCISFIAAIVYYTKYRSNRNMVDGTRKKKKGWLYWGSWIWVAYCVSMAPKFQGRLSVLLITMFSPLAILWGIAVSVKFFKQPKGEKPDRGFIIWANLVFWGYLGITFLIYRGM